MPELAAPRRGRRAWSTGLAVALLFVLSLPAVTTRRSTRPTRWRYFAYLRSLWFDHDVSFENEYQHFYDAGIAQARGFHETFLERTTEAGRRINFATLGCAIVWAPFYALGDLVARALAAAGRPVTADGYSWPYIAAVAYGSAAYGALSLVLAMRSARLLARGGRLGIGPDERLPRRPRYGSGRRSSSTCTLRRRCRTPLGLRGRGVRHGVAARPRDWTPAGAVLLGGRRRLMAMVREQDVFFVAGRHSTSRSPAGPRGCAPRRAPAGLGRRVAMVLTFMPQWRRTKRSTATWPVAPRRPQDDVDLATRHRGPVLARHGFLIWTPLAVLALAGAACGSPPAGAGASAVGPDSRC